MSSLNSSQAGNLILKRVEVKISEDENVKGYRGIGSGNGLHGIFPWMIMYTFFEKNAEGLPGKTLIPFSTHEGSGLSGFDKKLSSACPDATVLDGLAIRGNDCQNDQDSVRKKVSEWVTGLGY